MQSLLESAEPKALTDFFQKEMETDPDLEIAFSLLSEIGTAGALPITGARLIRSLMRSRMRLYPYGQNWISRLLRIWRDLRPEE